MRGLGQYSEESASAWPPPPCLIYLAAETEESLLLNAKALFSVAGPSSSCAASFSGATLSYNTLRYVNTQARICEFRVVGTPEPGRAFLLKRAWSYDELGAVSPLPLESFGFKFWTVISKSSTHSSFSFSGRTVWPVSTRVLSASKTYFSCHSQVPFSTRNSSVRGLALR